MLQRILRFAPIALVLLAIFHPSIPVSRQNGIVIAVADRSASIEAEAARSCERAIQSISSVRPADSHLGVVSFADGCALEQAPQAVSFDGFSAVIGTDKSDMNSALVRALELVPNGVNARLLLLSDGKFTDVDPALGAVRLAQEKKVPIDFRYLSGNLADPIAIKSLSAPVRLRSSEALATSIWIYSDSERTIKYTFSRDGNTIYHGTKEVPAGTSLLHFRDVPSDEVVSQYSIRIEADGVVDQVSGNNEARFIVTRSLDKPILLLSDSLNTRLASALRTGFDLVEVRTPSQIDINPVTLSGYCAIAIENLGASAFSRNELLAIVEWVSQAGGALLMTGGKNSFGIGGWRKSPIEPILPVSLEARAEQRKAPSAVAIVLDRSGSMGMRTQGGFTKMDLADAATAEVIRMLFDTDEITVLAVDTSAHTIIPLIDAGTALEDINYVLSIEPGGGGIFVATGLAEALKSIKASNAPIRHIILFSDASDSEQPEGCVSILQDATKHNITLSVIGLGKDSDCDAAFLQRIAKLGGGQCHFTDDAHDIPRLFVQDTMTFLRELFVTNQVPFAFTQSAQTLSDSIRGKDAAGNVLSGYNLTYATPQGTVAAFSLDENKAPIVAYRPVGRGRTAVYTGEADGAYSGAFTASESYAKIMAGLARYIAGNSRTDFESLHIEQKLTPQGVQINAWADTELLKVLPPSLVVQALYSSRGNATRVQSHTMEWCAPDQMSVTISLGGAETVLPILLPSTDSPNQTPLTLCPMALPYSSEYNPTPEGVGLASLEKIAALTGGVRRADVAAVWNDLPRGKVATNLAPLLYTIAVLLLLVDIFYTRFSQFLPMKTVSGAKESAPPPRTRIHVQKRTAPIPTATKLSTPPDKNAASVFKVAQKRSANRFK